MEREREIHDIESYVYILYIYRYDVYIYIYRLHTHIYIYICYDTYDNMRKRSTHQDSALHPAGDTAAPNPGRGAPHACASAVHTDQESGVTHGGFCARSARPVSRGSAPALGGSYGGGKLTMNNGGLTYFNMVSPKNMWNILE